MGSFSAFTAVALADLREWCVRNSLESAHLWSFSSLLESLAKSILKGWNWAESARAWRKTRKIWEFSKDRRTRRSSNMSTHSSKRFCFSFFNLSKIHSIHLSELILKWCCSKWSSKHSQKEDYFIVSHFTFCLFDVIYRWSLSKLFIRPMLLILAP